MSDYLAVFHRRSAAPAKCGAMGAALSFRLIEDRFPDVLAKSVPMSESTGPDRHEKNSIGT
jgi:hypothetical protein